MDKPFSVLYWLSHPDQDNDDCLTGADFDTAEEAIQAFKADPSQVISWLHDYEPAFIEIDGIEDSDLPKLGITRVRKNPKHKRDTSDDREWQREIANEAGMLHGIDAYNEAMGYDTGYDE